MNDASTLNMVTFGLAVLGAVLGLINTWHAVDKSRVKLRVRPSHAIPFGGADERLKFAVEVTNLSAFPITISDVGVFFEGTNQRVLLADGVFSDNMRLPHRLESRSSFSVYSQIPYLKTRHRLKSAYATTQCGVTRTGTSPALRQIAREMSAS